MNGERFHITERMFEGTSGGMPGYNGTSILPHVERWRAGHPDRVDGTRS